MFCEALHVITYRLAEPEDRQAITDLHVSLSQSTYAHILPEPHLRDVVPGEKQALWARRFAAPAGTHVIAVARHAEALAGFCCFPLDEEAEFGTYLHNLYVSSDHQGKGIARALLRHAICAFDGARRVRPVHLTAFARNTRAVAMYERLGGRVIDRRMVTRDGNPPVEILHIQWPSADDLLERLDG